MDATSTFLAALTTLDQIASADERRLIWRQGMAALVAAAEREPAPLEGVAPDVLATVVRRATADGLLADLGWMSPAAMATSLLALAQALPPGADRRELGRRVAKELHGGERDTFVQLAAALALSSSRALDGAAARARIEVAITAPLASAGSVGPLSLALIARDDLAQTWLHGPSTGSLPDRRLAARLLAHAVRAAITRAAVGDLDGVRLLSSPAIRAPLERLLRDREALVWRFAAIARGLLAHALPDVAKEIEAELDGSAGDDLVRRGATSAAAALERGGLALRWRATILARATISASTAHAAMLGIAGLAATDPTAADSLATQLCMLGGLDAVETYVGLRRDEGMRELHEADAVARAWIERALAADDGSDDGRLALLHVLRAELGDGVPEEPLATAAADVRAAIDRGDLAMAVSRAGRAVTELATAVDWLERGDDDDAIDRRHALRMWRELDRTFFSDGTVGGALTLTKAGDSAASELGRLLGRLETLLLAREGTAETGKTVGHYRLRLVRLRTLVRLLDGQPAGSGDDGERRARRLGSTRTLMTRARLDRSPLRRAAWAAMSRAWDALLREDHAEVSDLVLALPRAFDPDEDFAIMREASMEPLVQRALESYAGLTSAGWAASDPDDLPALVRALDALDHLIEGLPRGRSPRVESVRGRAADLARTLRALADTPSRAALDVAVIDELAARLTAMTARVIGAHRRLGMPLPPVTRPELALAELARAIERVQLSQTGRFDVEISAAIDAAQGSLPPALATVVARILMRLAILPDVSAEPVRETTPRETALPSWLPMSRTMGGFYVLRALGTGAGGSVFTACRSDERDDPHAERVALKVPDYDGGAARSLSQAEFEAMFRDEAGALLAIPAHPNLAGFVTFDVRAKPKPILVMELVPGPTLERALELGNLDLVRVLAIIDGIGAGLEAMHAMGVAHLDLKPPNVILREGDGPPVLVDFGLAGRSLRPGCGSPHYGAPEVWQETSASIEPRPTDVYAYACIAYELLMGEPLVDADSLTGLLALHRGGGAQSRVRTAMGRAPSLASLAALLEPALAMDASKRPTVARLRAGFAAVGPDLRRRSWPLTA